MLVGTIVLVVKLVSFYKETVVSATFGLSEFLDTYYLAILIPSFFQLISIRALNNLFIPNYIIEKKTTQNLGSLQSSVFLATTILFIVLSILVLVFSHFFLDDVFPNHTNQYYDSIRNQIYLVVPCILLWGYSSIIGGLLEIENKFFHSTIAQLSTPIITIICILNFKDYFGEWILVASLLLGTIISFAYLVLIARHFKIVHIGRLIINENIKMMIKQYPPKITSALLTGINPFVDQFFAAQLAVGAIASMNYGIKLPTIMVGILMMAIGNVLLPYFSKVLTEDIKKAYCSLFKSLKIIFISSIIIVAIIIYWSNDIIRLLFERGEFTSDDTGVVSDIQKIAFIYVPFYLCTLVCVKFLTAANRNHFLAWVSLWNLLINLVLNILLVKKFGLYGLVLSTTLVYIISSVIYFVYTYRGYKKEVVQ